MVTAESKRSPCHLDAAAAVLPATESPHARSFSAHSMTFRSRCSCQHQRGGRSSCTTRRERSGSPSSSRTARPPSMTHGTALASMCSSGHRSTKPTVNPRSTSARQRNFASGSASTSPGSPAGAGPSLWIARTPSTASAQPESAGLEGRLWDLTLAAEHVQPTNKVQPKDDTLPDYDRPAIETVIVVVRRVMRLLGYSLEPPGSNPKATKKAHFTVTFKDLIAAGKLTPGDVLVFTDPVLQATATVRSDGRLELSGVLYDFPSAAAAVVRGRSTNGWADWGLVREDGTITLMKLREELTEPASPPEGKPAPA